MSDKLTPDQIANWRRVLTGLIGPYAIIIPESQIQAYKDKMQRTAQRMALADHVYAASEKDLDKGLHDTRDQSTETREANQHIEALEWFDALENREQESE